MGSVSPDPARRSERSRTAIHAAARELVAEQGFARTTIEGIAARAGVGKQTIYRWWPSKAAVLLDAVVAEQLPGDGAPPLPDTGDLAADLRTTLVETVAYLTAPGTEHLLRALTAEMQHDPVLAVAVRTQLLGPQMGTIVTRLAAAEVDDPELVTELLLGPIFHRWLLGTEPLDDAYVTRLVARVV